MSQVPSLFMLAIGKYMPEDMIEILNIADSQGVDLRTPVMMELQRYNAHNLTLERMAIRNLDYGGWWGLPGPISLHTYDIQP